MDVKNRIGPVEGGGPSEDALDGGCKQKKKQNKTKNFKTRCTRGNKHQSFAGHGDENIKGTKPKIIAKSATRLGFKNLGLGFVTKMRSVIFWLLAQPSPPKGGGGGLNRPSKVTLRRISNLSSKQLYMALSFCSLNITSDQGWTISFSKQAMHLHCSPRSYILAIFSPSLYPIKTSSSPTFAFPPPAFICQQINHIPSQKQVQRQNIRSYRLETPGYLERHNNTTQSHMRPITKKSPIRSHTLSPSHKARYVNKRPKKRYMNEVTKNGRRRDSKTEMNGKHCLLYTSPSPRDRQKSRMPSSA